MMLLSMICNFVIFLSTLIIVIRYFRDNGKWNRKKGLHAFRYFTCLSNIFCAAASLLMGIGEMTGRVNYAIRMLKYLGTVSVTLTLLTVLLFLGPRLEGGYKPLLTGSNFYMHLSGPLLAIVSFCFLERGEMSVPEAMLGLLPVLLYGILYLYKTRFAPEEKCWEDFYTFNRGRNWPVTYVLIIAGTVIICLIIRIL